MLPLYATRIEDLGIGDFVKIDCAAYHHVALLTPEALLRVGLSPAAKVLDLKGRLRCRGCGRKGRAVVSMGPELFVAIGSPHDAIPGLVFGAAFQGVETSRLTIFTPGGASLLAVLRCRQRAAHPRTDPSHDLAAAGAAF